MPEQGETYRWLRAPATRALPAPCVFVQPARGPCRGCSTRRTAATAQDRQAPRVAGRTAGGPCNRGLWAYLLRLHHILGHHKGGKHPELLGPQCHVAVHPFHEAGALQHHWQVLCASYRSKEFPNRLAQKPCVLTLLILLLQHSPNYSNLPFFFFPQTLSLAQFEDRIRETGCVQILIYITKGKALTILNSPWVF